MFNVMPPVFGGAPAPPDPIAIFGANLVAWWDAAVGVTIPVTEVTNWADQSGNANTLVNAALGGPQYVASDVDGTPSIFFNPALGSKGFNFTTAVPVGTLTTCWMFGKMSDTLNLKGLLWSQTGDAGFFAHSFSGATVKRPGVFDSAVWYTPAGPNRIGWDLFRMGGEDAATDRRSVKVNNDAEQTANNPWSNVGANWANLSRTTGSTQPIQGHVKQVVLVSQFVLDANIQNQQMLDYIKFRYPTLVTY